MKIKSIAVILFSCCIANTVLADDHCFVIGFHEPHTHIYDGPTFCNKAKFKNITVHGPLQIKNSNLTGKINVSGPIDSSDSTLGSIQINKQFTSQKVILKNHTKVNGNIVFLGIPGVVCKSVDSLITGKVINGQIKNIKK